MSKYTEEELNRALSDTAELIRGVPVSEEFALEDILAEFGTGAPAVPAAPEQPPAEEPASPAEEPVCASGPEPVPEPAEPEPPMADSEESAAPRERLVSLEDVMDRTVSAVMEEESAQRRQEMQQQERETRKLRRAALRRARLAAARRFARSLTEKRESLPASDRKERYEHRRTEI